MQTISGLSLSMARAAAADSLVLILFLFSADEWKLCLILEVFKCVLGFYRQFKFTFTMSCGLFSQLTEQLNWSFPTWAFAPVMMLCRKMASYYAIRGKFNCHRRRLFFQFSKIVILFAFPFYCLCGARCSMTVDWFDEMFFAAAEERESHTYEKAIDEIFERGEIKSIRVNLEICWTNKFQSFKWCLSLKPIEQHHHLSRSHCVLLHIN